VSQRFGGPGPHIQSQQVVDEKNSEEFRRPWKVH
jgi:hypothetical protein